MATMQATAATSRARAALAAGLATLMVVFSAAIAAGPAPGVAGSSHASRTALDPAVTEVLQSAPTVRVVVQLDQAALPDAVAAVRSTGGELGLLLPIVHGFAATVSAEGVDALVTTPGIRNVSLDGEVFVSHEPSLGAHNGDHFFPETINADDLRARGVDGSGVGIAIVDTGVTEVADLAGRVSDGIDFSAEGTTDDRYGHGTFVAGIAAGDGASSDGRYDGVAPGAHVVPVKIAGRNGASDISHVLAAIQWVVSFQDQYGIRVMNLSLGTDSTQPRMLSPLNYAVERAWDSGLVVVVSAGNWGDRGSGHIPKPADDPLVITVGATDSEGTRNTGDDTVAGYSSRGPSIADQIVKPDLVAPGSHIIATKSPGSLLDEEHPEAHIGSDYMRGSGTSYAAGVVSGAVALLLDAHPDWTPDQVKGALLAGAAPGPVGDPNVDGAGILDVAASAAIGSPTPANQGVMRGSGLGTLADDRGSLEIEITVDPVLELIVLLTGEKTAQDKLFDVVEYTTTEWSGAQWYGAQWYGAQWYGAQWYGAQWYGAQWYGAQWYGAQWY